MKPCCKNTKDMEIKRISNLPNQDLKEKILKEIDELENPYPKDIFEWNNEKYMQIRIGRFNEHCFKIVENVREKLKSKIKEMK